MIQNSGMFVQKGFYLKSNQLREPSAEECFLDFVQKGFYL